MHSYYLNLFSMTPNLLFCSLILFSLSPILLFYSPTLFSSTPKVFSASPTLLSCSPKILFGNPNLLFCSPILLSCSLLKYVATRKIRVKNNNYKNNKTQLKTTNGRLLTHAYVHLLADVVFAGVSPARAFQSCDRKVARIPQDAHSLGR